MPQQNDLGFQPRVLNGETTAWRNTLRNAIIEGSAYLISAVTRRGWSIR